jgi:exopolyphosphatase/guanosine-5'-triphosphate,3'-diphosphate pyrophosphatase
MRTAHDGREFLTGLCEEGALDRALLLTGQEEAEVSVETNRRQSEAERMAVIDVGGGSTELAWTTAEGGVEGLSGPLGCVRYTEAFLPEHPIPGEDLHALRERVRQQAEIYPTLTDGTEVTAVAGTATTLAALQLALDPYEPDRVEGYRMGMPSLEHWIASLAALSVPERRRLPGLEAGRADVIVAGLVILSGVLARVGVAEFRVSGLGVRHGVALRLLDAAPAV